eukprot:2328140-Karenia_brevis.AAC.1
MIIIIVITITITISITYLETDGSLKFTASYNHFTTFYRHLRFFTGIMIMMMIMMMRMDSQGRDAEEL